MTKTDERRGLIAVAVILYITSPLAFSIWLLAAVIDGSYPLGPDAPAVTFAGFTKGWVAALPYLTVCCIGFELMGRRVAAVADK